MKSENPSRAGAIPLKKVRRTKKKTPLNEPGAVKEQSSSPSNDQTNDNLNANSSVNSSVNSNDHVGRQAEGKTQGNVIFLSNALIAEGDQTPLPTLPTLPTIPTIPTIESTESPINLGEMPPAAETQTAESSTLLNAQPQEHVDAWDWHSTQVIAEKIEPAILSNAASPWLPISPIASTPSALPVFTHSKAAGILALSLAYALAMLHRTSFTEVASVLGGESSLNTAALAWIGSAFFWVYLIFQIPAGILVDSAGSRRVAAMGCLAMAAGAALFASANNVWLLGAARGLCAIGAVSAFMALIAHCSRSLGEHSSVALGRALLIGNMGGVMAGFPLEVSISNVGWRSVWYVMAIFGVVGAYATWKYLHSVEDSKDRDSILASMRRGIPAFKDSLRHSDVYLAAGALAGLAGAFHAFSGFGAHVFSINMGINSSSESIMISIMVLGFALGALLWGRVGDTIKGRRMSLIFAPVLSLLLWLVLAIDPPSSIWLLSLALFTSGVLSASFANIYSVLDDLSGSRARAALKGTANCGIALGAAVSQVAQGNLSPGMAGVPSVALAILGVFCCWILAMRIKQLKQTESVADSAESFDDLAEKPFAAKA